MTIKDMRDLMREKVVPEEVVPQNIVNSLIDEEAEPPKLDAFTFLMRLRALGIGSADFLNLLEGCDAPREVIDKIKRNPAMNLQGLVLVLEKSELTSENYTSMLLTARQVWERTLTLRLERTGKLYEELENEALEEMSENEDVKEYPSPESDDKSDDNSDDESDDDYDEDLRELSFTAVFERINNQVREESAGSDKPPAADSDLHSGKTAERIFEETKSEQKFTEEKEKSFTAIFDKITPDEEAVPDLHSGKNAEEIFEEAKEETESDYSSADFTSDFDKIKEQSRTESKMLDTSTLVNLDEAELGELNFEYIGDDDEESEDIDDNEITENAPRTAKQKKKSEAENEDEDKDKDERGEEDDNPPRVYHKRAIICSAVGAALLLGAGYCVNVYIGSRGNQSLKYAADNTDIFKKIYHAYNDKITGGQTAYSVGADHHTVFGDLLITDGNKRSYGCFTEGNVRYSVTEESVTVNAVEGGAVKALDTIVPPEDARFVAVFEDNGALYVLFSGKSSGYIKLSEGKAAYTVYQDGILTDYSFRDGVIKLGTVYTPVFGHTFTINDTEVYLPKIGKNPVPIAAEKIIISDTEGYSYGVSAEYSAQNGDSGDVCAVIGDPAAASCDKRFVLNGEDKGVLADAGGEKIISQEIAAVTSAAVCSNGFAVVEKPGTENTGSESHDVKLYDRDFKLSSVLTGVPEKLRGMWFDNNVLTANGETNAYLRADCSDFSAPKPLKLRSVTGVVAENSALTFETASDGIIITRFDIEQGVSKQTAQFKKKLTAEELASVKFGEAAAMITNGKQSGAAYSYFDGVSVVSEYVVFSDGMEYTVSVFDDATGFTAAYVDGGVIRAVCSEGVKNFNP